MSILILRKPEAALASSDAIPGVVVTQLVARAAQAGRTLAIRDCSTDEEIAVALEQADAQRVEFVLLDPGSAPRCSGRYQAALESLRAPFIEVHDDAGTREGDLCTRAVPGVPRVHGYAAQGYVMALEMALERLGCDQCGNRYHVGT